MGVYDHSVKIWIEESTADRAFDRLQEILCKLFREGVITDFDAP